MYCRQCGHHSCGTEYCAACGLPLIPWTWSSAPLKLARAGGAAGAAAAVLVLTGVVALGLVFMNSGKAGSSVGGAEVVTSPTETSTASASRMSKKAVVASTRRVSDVSGLPGGLTCVDLRAAGYGYPATVRYWVRHGRPARQDENLDGVPCQSVFSAGAVQRHLAPAEDLATTSLPGDRVSPLPGRRHPAYVRADDGRGHLDLTRPEVRTEIPTTVDLPELPLVPFPMGG